MRVGRCAEHPHPHSLSVQVPAPAARLTVEVLKDSCVEPEPFGAALRQHRLAAGLSQERLAELARISTEAVGALERGTRKIPQRQTLELLVEALQLEPADRAAFTLAAVRPQQPRVRTPRIDQPPGSFRSSPLGLTSFVGREPDITAVLSLAQSARLVTILGPGGVGKSRLALELTRQVAPPFQNHVHIVALGPLVPNSSVLPAITAGLGIHDEGSVTLEGQIAAAIGQRAILLIVDNCEHVLDDLAPAVHHLLSLCAGLRIIATSRERLGVDGERIYRLQPLSIGHAVDVFIDRATANGFDPENSADDLSIAAEICDRLDRMPLAIELAASCSNVLAFEAILARLRERIVLPATPKRSALPQHRSMQALVEWSYDRLEPNDAIVFRRLAPFLGGCRLDDAQDILRHDTLTNEDILYSLFRLHEQSLIDADRASMPRFQMLQTIRDFANTQLLADERTALYGRFSGHYFSVVAELDSMLRSARQNAAIARISAEWMNVRAALSYVAADAGFSTDALMALGALSNYWLRTGTLTEGAQLLAAIDFSPCAPSAGLAAALTGAAFLELNRGSLRKAHEYAARARAVARAIDHPWFGIYAAIAEHTIASASGTFAPDEPFEPFYARALELGDPWLIGSAACRMAMLVPPGDVAARNEYLEYALRCAQSSGDMFAIQAIQFALARSIAQDEPYRALEFTIAVWLELSPAHLVRKVHCIECFAEIAEVVGRLDDAAFLVGIALSISRQSGSPDSARSWLAAFAQKLSPERAALISAGEQATSAGANERIAAFLQSFAYPRPVE
jgi:predicted ATPase